jgi:hypothetical protein
MARIRLGSSENSGGLKSRRHYGQTRSVYFWSALQTHLQGLDGATLAMVPEKCQHAQRSFRDGFITSIAKSGNHLAGARSVQITAGGR